VPTRWSPSLVTTLICVSPIWRPATLSISNSVLILHLFGKVNNGFSALTLTAHPPDHDQQSLLDIQCKIMALKHKTPLSLFRGLLRYSPLTLWFLNWWKTGIIIIIIRTFTSVKDKIHQKHMWLLFLVNMFMIHATYFLHKIPECQLSLGSGFKCWLKDWQKYSRWIRTRQTLFVDGQTHRMDEIVERMNLSSYIS